MLKLPMPAVSGGSGSRTPFARRASAVLLGGVLAGSVIAVAPAQAAVSPAPVEQTYRTADRGLGVTLKAGPILLKKYGFKDEHLGLLSVGGKWGICYDYGEKSPDGSWKSGPIADVRPGKNRDRMQWIANAYWADAQKNDTNAAAYKSAINLVRSKEFTSDWRKSYVPQLKRMDKASVVTLAERMVAESAKYAGPAKVTLDFSKPAPGGKGVAVAKLTVGGKPYPGRPVKWTITGASTTAAGKTTGKDGTAKLTFIRSAGPVSITATPTVPEWREAGYTVPSRASIQHLIRGGYSTNLKASGKFDSLAGATVSQKCDSTCDGKPPVTITAKSSGSPIRWQAIVDGKPRTLEVTSGTKSLTFTGRDGQDIPLRYSVKVGGKWSEYRHAKTYKVICPAAPVLTIGAICDCKGKGTAAFKVTAPAGPRSYEVSVGGQTKRIDAGGVAEFPVPVKAIGSTPVTWTAFDGAKRIGGGKLW